MRRMIVTIALFTLCSGAAAQGAEELGLRFPDGFVVTEFANEKLANDIYSMTLDSRGRIVVSGRGYVNILVDEDDDGRADRAIRFADGPADGAMGMLWEDSTLYVTGDGGLRRYADADGDGRADGPSESIRALKTGGEHSAHAIRRGPDGWLYVLCGNMTGIDVSFAQTPTSPISDPVAGCVIRFSPDLKRSEIVADGFRNAYDMDFNGDGELFLYDSDNERCVSLPWYEFTRFYHVIPGGRHGWLSPQRTETWRYPPYFTDAIAPVSSVARGSPTGVACYRHTQFPERYRGGMFLLDWTFGKVYFMPLTRRGSTYRSDPETFIEPVGGNGFAPTDVVVHPETGDLFVSIGGRGARGAVYRIRHGEGSNAIDPGAVAKPSSKPMSLEWEPSLSRALPRQATEGSALERRRALEAIRRFRPEFDEQSLGSIVRSNWDHDDRYVRLAAARLMAELTPIERATLAESATTPHAIVTACLATNADRPKEALTRATRLFATATDDATRLDCVRLAQLALGDVAAPNFKGTVWEGYSIRKRSADPAGALEPFTRAFPTTAADLDRELARTFAMAQAEDSELLRKVAGKWTTDSDPIDDIHYLICFARLRGARSADETHQVVGALLSLDRKIEERGLNRDRNWSLRMLETHAELARKDGNLNSAMVADPRFGRPGHALFAETESFERRRAAEIFKQRLANDPDYGLTVPLVELIAVLPAEDAFPLLRAKDRDLAGGLSDAIAQVLAREPREGDLDRFLAGLQSTDLHTVGRCLDALTELAPSRLSDERTLSAIIGLLRVPEEKETVDLRDRFGRFLRRVTGRKDLGSGKEAWRAWFLAAHPESAARLRGADRVDLPAWKRRLAAIDWSAGDAERGRGAFVKATCSNCHSGARALGPDLRGVASRFSRADLFTAIVAPSRDVSDRYRAILLATDAGEIHQGIPLYEAVDSLILQTAAAKTVRIPIGAITARRTTRGSIMPAGLLDQRSDREIADLYAYLQSLGK